MDGEVIRLFHDETEKTAGRPRVDETLPWRDPRIRRGSAAILVARDGTAADDGVCHRDVVVDNMRHVRRRHDGNGDYVLVMESKSSPLGNRYVASRYDVQKIVSNDTKTAVSGLTGSEYVITTSSKPIEPGQNVRPTDTN